MFCTSVSIRLFGSHQTPKKTISALASALFTYNSHSHVLVTFKHDVRGLYQRPSFFCVRCPPLPCDGLHRLRRTAPARHIYPPMLSLVVGPKYVGPIHGRVLLASSAAALAGPSILLSLRSKSEMSAIHDLVAKVDPARFQQVFSAGVEDAQALIEVSLACLIQGRGAVELLLYGTGIGTICSCKSFKDTSATRSKISSTLIFTSCVW